MGSSPGWGCELYSDRSRRPQASPSELRARGRRGPSIRQRAPAHSRIGLIHNEPQARLTPEGSLVRPAVACHRFQLMM